MAKSKRSEELRTLLRSKAELPANGGVIETHEGMRELVTEILDLVDEDPTLPRPTLETITTALQKFFPAHAPRSNSTTRRYLMACEAERYNKLRKYRGR